MILSITQTKAHNVLQDKNTKAKGNEQNNLTFCFFISIYCVTFYWYSHFLFISTWFP